MTAQGAGKTREPGDWLRGDSETDVVPGWCPETAMCVQDVDDQCVLQFTLSNAAGCALHRPTSLVIHRLELCSLFQRDHHHVPRPGWGPPSLSGTGSTMGKAVTRSLLESKGPDTPHHLTRAQGVTVVSVKNV